METRKEEEDGSDCRRGGIWRFKERRKMAVIKEGRKTETRREEEYGCDYRRGGRCRLEERRKMVAITGGEEDGD
jgi:hypothetical protein